MAEGLYCGRLGKENVWWSGVCGDSEKGEGAAVGRGWPIFCLAQWGGRWLVFERDRFSGLGFFLLPSKYTKLFSCKFSPSFVVCVVTFIYRQSGLVPKTHWSHNFFIFVNFDFFLFFCIFESEQYQLRLNKENQ